MNMSLPPRTDPAAAPAFGQTTGKPLCLLAAAIVMLVTSTTARSQSHQSEFGPYVLRSSTVSSQNISEETARAHGIERDPRRAILNVTVLKKSEGIDETVPARVQASTRNLTGREREIDMRETVTQGRVSYMGTYEFVPNEVLDFTVSAQPEGSSETLTMTYRDRMWAK